MLLAVFAHIAVLVRLMAVLGRCRAVCTVCGVAAWLPVYVAMVAVAARRSVVAVSAVMAMSSVGISETCRRAYDCHYGYHHYDKCLFHVFSLSWMSLAARCTCFFCLSRHRVAPSFFCLRCKGNAKISLRKMVFPYMSEGKSLQWRLCRSCGFTVMRILLLFRLFRLSTNNSQPITVSWGYMKTWKVLIRCIFI